MKTTTWVIGQTWDGAAIAASERVVVKLELTPTALNVGIAAPFHNDPAPPGPPGSLDGLWDYEVVELFLRGSAEAYLELEFGPFGHYLALCLDGPRQVRRSGLSLDYTCERRGERWSGRCAVPAAYLPAGLRSGNAYAIHGNGAARRFLAMRAPGGSEPDFHRLESFAPLSWTGRG